MQFPRNPTFVMPDATRPTGGSLRVNSNTVLEQEAVLSYHQHSQEQE
ncbi:MAG: hypothetical protein IPI04_09830 [Ignavibacteria bacterium]|nr:hypothetical protein [Ignavibacteria bacterium]